MDAKQVRTAVGTIVTALAELQALRWHRTGKWTAEDLRTEIDAMNRGAAAGNGLLLRQKAQWFNADSVRKELGNLKTIMETLARCLDEDVRREIDAEGYSLGKTIQPINVTLQFIEEMRAALNRHESLQNKILQGQPVDTNEIISLERQLLELTDFEEQVAPLDEIAMQRVTNSSQYRTAEKQPRSTLQRLAAAVVLPVAAAAAMFFGMSGTTYAQETAKAPQASAQQQSIDNQIVALEAKQNKTADDYLTLTQLYTKADRLDKANDTIKAYLASNPNDIRGLVAKRDLDGKKGVTGKEPDDELLKLLGNVNRDSYQKMLAGGKYKEIIEDIEPNLQKIIQYDYTQLNDTNKGKLTTLTSALGQSYYQLQRKSESLVACTITVDLLPNSPITWSLIGQINIDTKNYDAATNAYKKCAELTPDKHHGFAGLGFAHAGKGDYQSSLDNFQKALELAPQELKAKYQKAIDVCKQRLANK